MQNNEPIWFGEGVERIDLTTKKSMVNPNIKSWCVRQCTVAQVFTMCNLCLNFNKPVS